MSFKRKHTIAFLYVQGPSWPCPYGSWIYNYLCNQCLSPLILWVRILIRARWTTLCDQVYQWHAIGRWFSPGPSVSSTDKTDRHDITEILLKVAFNTIKQTNISMLDVGYKDWTITYAISSNLRLLGYIIFKKKPTNTVYDGCICLIPYGLTTWTLFVQSPNTCVFTPNSSPLPMSPCIKICIGNKMIETIANHNNMNHSFVKFRTSTQRYYDEIIDPEFGQ